MIKAGPSKNINQSNRHPKGTLFNMNSTGRTTTHLNSLEKKGCIQLGSKTRTQ